VVLVFCLMVFGPRILQVIDASDASMQEVPAVSLSLIAQVDYLLFYNNNASLKEGGAS